MQPVRRARTARGRWPMSHDCERTCEHDSTCDHNPCTVSESVINVAHSPPKPQTLGLCVLVHIIMHIMPLRCQATTSQDYDVRALHPRRLHTLARRTEAPRHPRRTVRRADRNPSYPGIAISGARHPRQYAGIVRALARNPRGCTSVIARFTTNRKMGAIASDFAYSPTLSRTASGAV